MEKSMIKLMARGLLDRHNLRDWSFKFNKRKKSIGLCDYRKRTIYLSEYYTSESMDFIRNVILHEIAHALTRGHHHDNVWRSVALNIGCDAKVKTITDIEVKGKYQYKCPNCGKVYNYYRKLKYENRSCAKCNPYRYDERYKLVRVE